MLTSHFLQVQVKSQVAFGCNERSIICCMPSDPLRTLNSYIQEIQSMYGTIISLLSLSIEYYHH